MFPSILNTFNRPTTTDRLNSPSHSALHNAVSSALGQVEAVIGVEGDSSVVGTLEYLIKSPASDGGGHVQTANKGGTGQTSFMKGDILAAESSSVLAKLAIGTDGQVLLANSSTATGVGWGIPTATKIFASASVSTLNSVGESSVLNTTIPGSTLGTNNVVRTTIYVNNLLPRSGQSVLTAVRYGGQTVASVMIAHAGSAGNSSLVGTISHTMIANNSHTLQRHYLSLDLKGSQENILDYAPANPGISSVVQIKTLSFNTTSISSGANQAYGVTIRAYANSDSPVTAIETNGAIIEKIV